MSKGAYYAGMAVAPKVKPADLATPFANMFQRLREDEILKRKEEQAQAKADEKFALSNQEKMLDQVSNTGAQNFGVKNLDQAKNLFMAELTKGYEDANASFNIHKDKARLNKETSALIGDAKQVSGMIDLFNTFQDTERKLDINGKSSHYNDLVMSFYNDLGNSIGFQRANNYEQSIYTIGEDGIKRALPIKDMQDFTTAKVATDLDGVLQEIVDNTQPRVVDGETRTYSRYLDYSKDPEGILSNAQANILTKRLQNFSPDEIYDASVRLGIVGDNEGQIPLITDFTSENVIANIGQMRDRLALEAVTSLQDMYRNKESSKPRTPRGGTGTNKSFAVYDNDTGIYSYRKGSQTSFTLRNGFKGVDMINGQPSGKEKDIPPSSYVTDIRLTPAGVEVWGVQIKDRVTGEVQWSDKPPTSLSDEEVTQMGGNRVNFHKVIPVNETNQQAIGELQRIFGFSPEDLEAQLALGVRVNNEESGETVSEGEDLNNTSKYE